MSPLSGRVLRAMLGTLALLAAAGRVAAQQAPPPPEPAAVLQGEVDAARQLLLGRVPGQRRHRARRPDEGGRAAAAVP